MPDISRLTLDEQDAFRKTADLMIAISKLPELHYADIPETVRDIHNIQNRLLARAAYKRDL